MRLFLFALSVAFLLSGCAINLSAASRYAQGCEGFQAQNEWWKARQACGRAAINAELGGASANTISSLWFEYGGASGVICDYAEARKGFEKSMKLDEAAGSPVFGQLLQLARVAFAQGDLGGAIGYYERYFTVAPRSVFEKVDPIGFAQVREELAEAYRRAGNAAAAKTQQDLATELRKSNPGAISRSAKPPYGQFCNQKS